MNDQNTTIITLKNIIKQVVEERDWQQFHSPKDFSMNLSIEANELMEKFLWMTSKASFDETEKNKDEIADEAGDVIYSILQFCSIANIDATQALLHTIEKVKQKYPVEKAKGVYTKYNKL